MTETLVEAVCKLLLFLDSSLFGDELVCGRGPRKGEDEDGGERGLNVGSPVYI